MTISVFSLDFQFVSFMDYYGGIEPSEGYEHLRNRIFISPKVSGFSNNGHLEWQVSGQFWYQTMEDPEWIEPWDILGESFLFLQSDNFDMTVGQKIISYGFSDLYGPLNVLHSTNRTTLSVDDPYDSRRPDPLIQIRYFPDYTSSFELTYIPVTRPDIENQNSVALTESNDLVQWSDEPFLLENLHSVFLNYSRYGELFDLQLFYGWYTEHTPDFNILELNSEVSTVISPVYHKKHTLGAAYSTGLGYSTLSQDLALNLAHDLDGSDLGGQNSDITLNSQLLMNLPGNILSQFSFVYSYIINYEEDPSGADADAAEYLSEEIQSFHNQPYEHIAFMVGHFERSFLREKLKSQINIAFFFSPDILLTPRLSYALNDYWNLDTGADITLGEPSDLDLRRNPGNDNFYIRMVCRY
jgi:hypothetical protein